MAHGNDCREGYFGEISVDKQHLKEDATIYISLHQRAGMPDHPSLSRVIGFKGKGPLWDGVELTEFEMNSTPIRIAVLFPIYLDCLTLMEFKLPYQDIGQIEQFKRTSVNNHWVNFQLDKFPEEIKDEILKCNHIVGFTHCSECFYYEEYGVEYGGCGGVCNWYLDDADWLYCKHCHVMYRKENVHSNCLNLQMLCKKQIRQSFTKNQVEKAPLPNAMKRSIMTLGISNKALGPVHAPAFEKNFHKKRTFTTDLESSYLKRPAFRYHETEPCSSKEEIKLKKEFQAEIRDKLKELAGQLTLTDMIEQTTINLKRCL